MRLRTVATLLSGRRDVVVVSSVSCLYGAGNPADFHATAINIRVGQVVSYKHFLYKLVEALYTRTDVPEIAASYPLAEDHYMAAADVQRTYAASENIDTLIDKAREDMERAAKSLDFLAAAKFRDRMYELQKLKEENRKG